MKITINGNPLNYIEDKIKDGVSAVVDGAKDMVVDAIKDVALWVLEGIAQVIVELSYSIALIGGGVCIVLYMAGWEKGLKWTGILFVANVLIRYLLG